MQANKRDLRGQRFGKLTVIRRVEGTQSNRARADSWLCRCDCGNESVVLGSNLVRGHTKSCGCIKLNDLTGQHIGSLTVLGRSDKYATRGKRSVRLWECKCDCGAITYKATDTLMAGVESSCAECAQKHNAACAIKNAGFIDGTQLSKIQNMKPSAANTSGCRGVSFNKKTLRWEAQIKFRGKRTRLESYKNFDDAVLVRKKAEQAIFGEFLDSLALESKKDE